LNPSHDILMMPNTDRYLEYVTAYFSVWMRASFLEKSYIL
jgi:hypothetical protein